ncbi:acyl-CoA N-acyltransferase [Dendrothele bispora CBS 962.96]|uniref:Acyl-CoA N-acyltransferase n=1 Tax=Dendrothele bispora (strain CBS 962.96) TaxID=1314807 RepID=A0A4V4HD00_DENBC|nr:acyl-CoA N-acyltransferase [Dendrothele bispora CBS 962.96]
MAQFEGAFTTDRLVLRPFRDSDAQKSFDLLNDIRVQPTIIDGYIAPLKPKFIEDFKARVNKMVFFAVLETKDTSEWVGLTSLRSENPKNRDGFFGIVLRPEHWEKGIGTEVTKWMTDYAFQCLAMHRVSLEVFELNERAIDLYKRVGFVEEGRKREGNWVNGRWTDVISMGMLEEEWRAQRS